MTQVLIKRELLERLLYSNSPARFDATEHNAARAELFAILANQTQQAEAVEVRGLQWLDTGHYRKKPPQFGYNPHDWNPLMTIDQHQRILEGVRQQRDKLAGLLREAAGELRTDRHHGLRPKIDAALSELTP